MIIRTEHNRNNPYYTKNRTAVEDERLSFKAKGLHDYLLSKPDHWQTRVAHLVKVGPDGEHSIRAAIGELIDAGYMHRNTERDEEGKFVGWSLVVFESPELNPHLCQDPLVENPLVGNPLVENPLVENPLVENHDHSKYTEGKVTKQQKGNTEVRRSTGAQLRKKKSTGNGRSREAITPEERAARYAPTGYEDIIIS